ncbi:hypothetical protein BH10PSE6_BH10PSE6_09670 [soil metagenome]
MVKHIPIGNGEPPLIVEVPDDTKRPRPLDPAFERKMAKADDIIRRYGDALHELSK